MPGAQDISSLVISATIVLPSHWQHMPGARDLTSLVISLTIVLLPFGNTCQEPNTSKVCSYQQPSCYSHSATHAGSPRHHQSRITNHRVVPLWHHMPGTQDINSLVTSATIVLSPFWRHVPGAQDITSLVVSATIVISPFGNTSRDPKTSPVLSYQHPSCYLPLAKHAGNPRHHQPCQISNHRAILPWQST